MALSYPRDRRPGPRRAQGRVAIVGDLLASRHPADTCDEAGFTPLIVAARAGHLEIVRMLMKAGAGGVPSGVAPEAFIREAIARERFYEAISVGDLGVMRDLLSEWPSLVRIDDAPCFWPRRRVRPRPRRSSSSPGRQLDLDRERRDNPLAVAADLGHSGIVKIVLEAGGEGLDAEYWQATRVREWPR